MDSINHRPLQKILLRTVLAAAACAAILPAAAWAQEANRKEIRRVDLSGAPGMEVISSVSEYKPGESIPLHIHHGIEAGIVLQGGMIQVPGKDAVPLPTGAPIMNLRDAPHAGWAVAGDTVIKLYTVHIVDKGKPLYDAPKK